MVLDDVFSGLDLNNTSMIATRLFGPGGYCRRYGVTVLLATHTGKFGVFDFSNAKLMYIYIGKNIYSNMQMRLLFSKEAESCRTGCSKK